MICVELIKVMKIYKNTEIPKEKWDQLLNESNNSSYFQSYECFNFYTGLSFLEPFAIAIEENENLSACVCGYIIAEGNILKKQFTRRAIIPGGIMTAPDASVESISLLLKELKNELSKRLAIYIEFRNYNDYSQLKPVFKNNGFQYKAHVNYHIDIKDADSALMKLNTTKRRDVRSSQRNGVEWKLSNDERDLHDYYMILSDLYKTKIKTPLFPEEFFQKLIQSKGGRFFVVKFNNEIIGGSICVELSDKILYEWFVCGIDGKYKNTFPSTVATWAAIEYAANNGLYRFDMMGAGKPDEGYGVRDFKSKFGGELVEHGRFLCVLNPFLYFVGKKAVEIIKPSNK